MLNRVQIKEYRCLREVDVPLKPLTVLIGPNNTGKSAFLSAIRLLGMAPSQGHGQLKVASPDLWQFERATSPKIVGYTDAGSELMVERGPAQQPIAQRSHWELTGDNSISPVNLFNSEVLQPAMESIGTEAKSGIPQIDDNASNVPTYLDVLLRKDRDRFFRVLANLRELIPGLVDLNIETPQAGSRRIDLKLESGLVMEAKHASYGVKLMIFFVALANHPEPPRTVLLEEPETGVHPKRLEDIVSLLIGLTEGKFADRPTQVILTTHSPYLLDCIDPEKHQVLVMQRELDGACAAHPVDTKRLKLFMDEFMLGEIWLNQDESGLLQKVS
ncbi:MAG: ATP-binding protein [Pirellulales bacterium]